MVVAGPDIPGYGNLVMISHPDGYLSLVCSLRKIFVERGDDVAKGAMIAQLGNSEAPYPMLRFQLRKDGKPIRVKTLTAVLKIKIFLSFQKCFFSLMCEFFGLR